MSKIGTEEVARLARLARVGLNEAELAGMAAEISRILTFVDQLQQVDIKDTPPTDQVTGLEDVWREDEVKPGPPRDQLLAGAPAQKDGYIMVKRVLNG